MSIKTDSVVNPIDVMNRWFTTVENTIISGAYTATKPPVLNGHQCIPSSMLSTYVRGNPSVGSEDTEVNALTVYNNLVSLTKTLTRVGTFSCVEKKNKTRWGTSGSENSYYNTGNTMSGKAIFSTAQIVNLASVPDNGVKTNITITAGNILDLITACLNSWNNTTKYHHSDTSLVCHDSCHDNCHSDCYSDCYSDCHDCHGDSSGSGTGNSGCKDYGAVGWGCRVNLSTHPRPEPSYSKMEC